MATQSTIFCLKGLKRSSMNTAQGNGVRKEFVSKYLIFMECRAGSQKLGYFSLMKYFGFILMTQSVHHSKKSISLFSNYFEDAHSKPNVIWLMAISLNRHAELCLTVWLTTTAQIDFILRSIEMVNTLPLDWVFLTSKLWLIKCVAFPSFAQ